VCATRSLGRWRHGRECRPGSRSLNVRRRRCRRSPCWIWGSSTSAIRTPTQGRANPSPWLGAGSCPVAAPDPAGGRGWCGRESMSLEQPFRAFG
jgi:hypothetical protein